MNRIHTGATFVAGILPFDYPVIGQVLTAFCGQNIFGLICCRAYIAIMQPEFLLVNE
jgi:hypothetical protein